jgi:membrane dipeptidase
MNEPPSAPVASPVVWEQHCCLPVEAGCDIGPLRRYLAAGVSYASVNVGFGPHDIEATMRVLSSWRRHVLADADFVLATSVQDVLAARPAGRLAVGFDLEDSNPWAVRSAWSRPITTWASGQCC